MRRSIAAKIFAAVMGLFLLLLLLQWFVVSRSFQTLYTGSMIQSMQRELRQAVLGFSGGGEGSVLPRLEEYSVKTGSPVLVFDDGYRIADQSFFNRLSLIQAKLEDGRELRIPFVFPRKDGADLTRSLRAGSAIAVKLVRLGNSSYYEPLSLTIGGTPYVNSGSMREYTVLQPRVPKAEGTASVAFYRSLSGRDSTQYERAVMIYNAVKECLITGADIEPFLAGLCSGFVSDREESYQFLYEKVLLGGSSYYFVTVQKIVVTGFEEAYVTRYFYGLYGLLGIVLLIAALFFSRRLSAPLRHLSRVTEQISRLDFSNQAAFKSQDELGQLSTNINRMSDSLEQALAELSQASQQAKSNEARMKLLLADLAHEFKTPLGLISGYVEAIRRGVLEKDPDYYFDIIERDLDRLTEMVNEAIELTKLQSGNWRVNLGDHSIAQIIDTVLKRFEKRFEVQGITLNTEITDALVSADAHRIGQVITNFLSNALKYCDDQRAIEVTARPDRERLTVAVGNSGSLSPAQEEKIWEREYRVSQEPQARLPSQGIGLDIVKSILIAHHSDYGIYQEEGMVFFYFTLELASEDHDPAI